MFGFSSYPTNGLMGIWIHRVLSSFKKYTLYVINTITMANTRKKEKINDNNIFI